MKVCRGKAPAETDHEEAYVEWRGQRLIEANQRRMTPPDPGIPEFEEGAPRSEFGTRSDYLRDRQSWKSKHI